MKDEHQLPHALCRASLDWFSSTASRYKALVFIVLAWMLFFLPELFGERVIYLRDIINQYFPLKIFVARALNDGHLPLWNPLVNCGEPALANPDYMVVYPGFWLYYLMPTVYFFQLHFLLHYLVGAIAFYFFIRPHVRRELTAAAGGLLWVLNGFALSHALFQNLVTYVALMPLFLCALRRAVWRLDGRNVVSLAGVVALAVLAIEPNYFLCVLLAGAVYLVLLAHRKRLAIRRMAVPLAGAAVLAGLLAAVQILPALSLVAGSQRSAGSVDDRYAFQGADVLQLLLPQPYGNFQTKITWQPQLRGDSLLPYFLSLYLGGVPLALALAGFAASPRWMKVGSAVVIGVGVWLAMGSAGGLYAWLWDYVPLLGYLRYPVKLLFLPMLVIVVLAVRGIDAFLDADWRQRRIIGKVLVAALGGMAAAASLPLFFPIGMEMDAARLMAARQSLGAQLVMQWMLLFGLVVMCFMPEKLFQRVCCLGVSVLIGVTFTAGLPILPTLPSDRFAPGNILSGLGSNDGPAASRIAPAGRPAAVPPALWQEEFRLYEALARNYMPLLLGCRSGLIGTPAVMESPGKHTFFQALGSNAIPWAEVRNVLRAHSVRYVPTLRPTGDPLVAVRELADGVPIFVQALADPVQELYAPERVVAVAAGESARVMFSRVFEPGHTAVREGGPAAAYPDDGEFRVLSYRRWNNGMEASVFLSSSRLLVWNETGDPGWKLWVDGAPEPIVPVNGFFQGFQMDAGVHQARFEYQPPFFTAGVILSVLGLVLAVLAVVFGCCHRK
ncbi:MAG: YfhO family protein [Acidobacteria bacterium]|nr:YfhO family protein [Acidobacteriota bacterium]